MKRLGLAVIVVGVAGMAMAGVTYYSRGDANNGSVSNSSEANWSQAVNPTFHVRMKNPRISWGFA